MGKFTTHVKCSVTGRKVTDEFVVIEGEGRPIIGRPTATSLGVLCVGPTDCVNSINDSSDSSDVTRKFDSVFHGVGKLKDFKVKLH